MGTVKSALEKAKKTFKGKKAYEEKTELSSKTKQQV